MSSNNLQLARAGDGTGNIRLMFWDSQGGQDVTWIITPKNGIFIEDEEDRPTGMKPIRPELVTYEFYKLMNHMEACENDY